MSGGKPPMMCGVCNIALEEDNAGRWLHAQELIGRSDHIAVPVAYDYATIRTICDFCYTETSQAEVWTVPARDFMMPIIPTMSVGGWAACPDCAQLLRGDEWAKLTDRATDYYVAGHPEGVPRKAIHAWLTQAYAKLADHMTGPVRPWQPGDEI